MACQYVKCHCGVRCVIVTAQKTPTFTFYEVNVNIKILLEGKSATECIVWHEQVSRAMSSRYFKDLHDFADCDVAIVGAGPSGLACAYELSKNPELKVEKQNRCAETASSHL